MHFLASMLVAALLLVVESFRVPISGSFRSMGRRGVRCWSVEEEQEEVELVSSSPPQQPGKYVSVFRTGLNITASNPIGAPCSGQDEAREELLDILNTEGEFALRTSDSRFRIEYLVQYLESFHQPIMTGSFLSLVLGGTWALRYSNVQLPRADESFSAEIAQKIKFSPSNPTQGVVKNRVRWELIERNGDDANSVDQVAAGDLIVSSSFTVTPKGALFTSLDEHVVLPKTLPKDFEHLLASVQRSIPFQFFDNDACDLATTYVDPLLRITRVMGPIYNGVYDIYTRTEEEEEAAEVKDVEDEGEDKSPPKAARRASV